jgi:hypothetical protein
MCLLRGGTPLPIYLRESPDFIWVRSGLIAQSPPNKRVKCQNIDSIMVSSALEGRFGGFCLLFQINKVGGVNRRFLEDCFCGVSDC